MAQEYPKYQRTFRHAIRRGKNPEKRHQGKYYREPFKWLNEGAFDNKLAETNQLVRDSNNNLFVVDRVRGTYLNLTAINEDGTWRGDPNTDRFKTVNINPYSDEYEEIFPRDIGGFRFQYELPAIKKKTPVVTYAPEFYTRNPGKVPTLTKTKPFKSSPKKTTSVKKSIGKKRGM